MPIQSLQKWVTMFAQKILLLLRMSSWIQWRNMSNWFVISFYFLMIIPSMKLIKMLLIRSWVCQLRLCSLDKYRCTSLELVADYDYLFIACLLPLFTGPGGCRSMPCQNNGTCTTTGRLQRCTCLPGYTGSLCDKGNNSHLDPVTRRIRYENIQFWPCVYTMPTLF